MLIADLIYSNLDKHPVYFATTTDDESYEGYSKNLLRQIITFQLTYDHRITGDMYENIDTAKGFQFASQIFHWSHAGEAVSYEKLLCTNYRLHLMELARELARDDKRSQAESIIDLCLKNFGNDKLAFNYSVLPLAEACYMLGNYEQGNHITKQIVYNYLHMVKLYDNDLILHKEYKYRKILTDVRELMNRFSQDTKFLDNLQACCPK
jgi:hypothetical protein